MTGGEYHHIDNEPAAERLEDTPAFYAFIFDGVVPVGVGKTGHTIYEGDVTKVARNINLYIESNPNTKAQIMMIEDGKKVATPWLSACDPDSHFFIVVNLKD